MRMSMMTIRRRRAKRMKYVCCHDVYTCLVGTREREKEDEWICFRSTNYDYIFQSEGDEDVNDEQEEEE